MAEEVQEQQKPWLAYTFFPLASVAQPQVGEVLKGLSTQPEMGLPPPVLMIACAQILWRRFCWRLMMRRIENQSQCV